MMLTVLKGPISYEDIKKVAGIQLNTFREACFAMGFLGDDKEFIGAISYNGQTRLCMEKNCTMVVR
jgi:hypothetical protein